ncbi:sulfite exporter TauE/SafE family protein [Marichromatium bheemlicum]|uniref:Sulfite exporter TauE/SafE family protein n=1 Tax=Marichromatium bheemlicum TaxID=365339 RepID=A0ABX1I9Y2_9GAMM|nr:sulfite exporter TauE/SafE family protein [Marichromatium bheemlicum]NKN32985.1 sulfite exporter TauE/SafE family protein [Marichromatium bheemlicum]
MLEQAPLGLYPTAFLVGLLGGVHCLGMCGGVAGTLTLGLDPTTRTRPLRLLPFLLAYNLARIAGYALAGALVGALGALLVELGPLLAVQRALYGLAGVVMILLGLYLGGWWRALAPAERLGLVLWRRLEPLGRALLPIRTLPRAALIGLIWAWLPCGLVYSMLINALASADAGRGALVMLAFGAGTLPTLVGLGLLAGAAARLGERVWVRRLAGVVVMGFGVHALGQLVVLR